MKNRAKNMALAAMLALLSACAGMGVRQDSMAELSSIWHNTVEPIAIVGIGAEQDAGGLDAERAAELRGYVVTIGDVLDRGAMGELGDAREAWTLLRPALRELLDQQVDRGAIGPGVAESLKLTLDLFAARLLDVGGGA